MTTTDKKDQRGFTSMEKWIIWAVFCLLVGLSTYRFSVFAGLMLVSAGASLVVRKQKPGLGIGLCLIGGLCLAFSKFLI